MPIERSAAEFLSNLSYSYKKISFDDGSQFAVVPVQWPPTMLLIFKAPHHLLCKTSLTTTALYIC